jgi:structure-specific recognition protein 1
MSQSRSTPRCQLSDLCTREDVDKYDRLRKHYEDPTFEVVSSVFRALAKKKIIGAGSFQRYVSVPSKAIDNTMFSLQS